MCRRHGQRSYRLIPFRANGQPAFGRYARDPQAGLLHATGLTVLSLDAGKIGQITAFLGHDLLTKFALPRTLPG
ncbi:MAG TPA: hypothetical protein VGH27_25150 [Streptosporangiaceae bacterium]|jgi:RNA polymerase sigma-70 factor (ECF subfamily)